MLVDFRGLIIQDLDGKDIPESPATEAKDGNPAQPVKYLTFSRAVSSILISDKTVNDPVKMYEMALSFRKNEFMDLGSEDLDTFEKAVKATGNYIPLVVGQILLKVRQLKVLDADAVAKKKAAGSNPVPEPLLEAPSP